MYARLLISSSQAERAHYSVAVEESPPRVATAEDVAVIKEAPAVEDGDDASECADVLFD